jgi:ATP-dependent RNA helicase RhlE
MHTTFSDLGVSRAVIDALAERGITQPFPIQALVMSDALAGRDVLAKSQTGSGKTLAFAIPIVERTPRDAQVPAAVVLVPTRELAVQVADDTRSIAEAMGLRVALAYGGTSVAQQAKAARSAHVLIATPGRLEDLVSRGLVKLDRVRILILDEADRMLDMGFQPQVDRLVRRMPSERQTMFLSATLEGAAGHLARAYTRQPVTHEVVAESKTVEEVDHRFLHVDAARKAEALVEVLKEQAGLVLVFVRTKRGADRLVRKIRAAGIGAEAMHGDLSQPARERALRRFETGRSKVLIATDVAARGLDVEAVSLVVNFDPPEDHRGYVHRVGRTGRAGNAGTGITLVTSDQQGDVGRIAKSLDLHDEFADAGLAMPAPRVVFSGSVKGRRSGLRSRGRR